MRAESLAASVARFICSQILLSPICPGLRSSSNWAKLLDEFIGLTASESYSNFNC
jgi:hypothetical protein